MQNSKFEAYIGFSIKSGAIIYGSDNIFNSRKKVSLIIVDESTNVKVLNKLLTFSNTNGYMLIKSNILLSKLTNRENVKVVGLLNKNLTKAILNNCSSDFIILKEGENNIGK